MFIIKYGTVFCIIMMIITFFIFVNNTGFSYSHTTDILCKTAVVTSVYVFAESVIGGLCFELYKIKKG